MTATQATLDAYKTVRVDKDVESAAILEVTRRLKTAYLNRVKDFPAFVDALHENCRLWIVLSSDVALKENGLSPDLKSKIFYLGEFVRQHTKEVRNGLEDCQVLIDINLSIYCGLSMKDASK
ncbi:flagellar biosynthesis regulator FlaF [Marivita sp. S0852]|uniref:flagellar biosynthesis regulator FlaF n=1 Tax=Marivita sp. S0852 TaxID=3373893 RepID=UPI00398246FB